MDRKDIAIIAAGIIMAIAMVNLGMVISAPQDTNADPGYQVCKQINKLPLTKEERQNNYDYIKEKYGVTC